VAENFIELAFFLMEGMDQEQG